MAGGAECVAGIRRIQAVWEGERRQEGAGAAQMARPQALEAARVTRPQALEAGPFVLTMIDQAGAAAPSGQGSCLILVVAGASGAERLPP